MTKKIKIQLLICLFVLIFSEAQSQTSQGESVSCWSAIDGATNWYADSLNLIRSASQLPHYLNDYLVDWKLRHRLRDCVREPGEITSFRHELISRVFREDVLEWIINSKNVNYDSLYVPEQLERKIKIRSYHNNDFPVISFMNYSWRGLAAMRLEQLKKRRKSIRQR